MRLLFISLICLALSSCGSDSTSFSGVWQGTFTDFRNECPFRVFENLNELFPLTVSEDDDGVFTVLAADGSIATGSQGDGETISFLASSANFGNYGPITPYSCNSLSTIRFLSAGDSSAAISLVISFTNCSLPVATDEQIEDCNATYRWDGTKL